MTSLVVNCPACEAGFKLPSAPSAKGTKLRCSKCRHTFRVRAGADGEPEIFTKPGDPPSPGADADEVDGDKTAFGFPASKLTKSLKARELGEAPASGVVNTKKVRAAVAESQRTGKAPSLVAGIRPHPKTRTRLIDNDRTVLGPASRGRADELEDLLGAEGTPAVDNDSTMLGPSARSAPTRPVEVEDLDKNDRTVLGPSARSTTVGTKPVPRPAEPASAEAKGDETSLQWGSDSIPESVDPELDLFGDDDDAAFDAPEDDPFGDAFAQPAENDPMGLVLPSTPREDSAPSSDSISLPEDDESLFSDSFGMSDEAFLLGGTDSEFGMSAALAESSFVEDGPSFDASGVHGQLPRKTAKPARQEPSTHEDSDPLPSLDDAHVSESLGGVSSVAEDLAPARKEKPRRSPGPEAEEPLMLDLEPVRKSRKSREPAPQARDEPAPTTADRPAVNRQGSDTQSPPPQHDEPVIPPAAFYALTGVLGFALLALLVVAVAAGGFVDFSRFGHTLSVAFGGADFQPREEWKVVVELPAPDPPPDDPLRIERARAYDIVVGDTRVLVVQGVVRNYSVKVFDSVSVQIELKDGNEVLATRTVTAGKTLSRAKLAKAESVGEIAGLMVEKLPQVGKEGTIPFVMVFSSLSPESIESGNLDYTLRIVE